MSKSLHYLLLNKPYGVLSQFTDEGTGHRTLKHYIATPGVYAAGRLDRDSEGLLVLTNDGSLIQRMTDPKNHVVKQYLAQVEGEYSSYQLRILQIGINLKGYRTLPCRAALIGEPDLPAREKPVTPHGPTFWLQIEVREGKKRQIRQMTAALGWPTLRLVRWAIGGMTIAELAPGSWVEMSGEEIRRKLREAPAGVALKGETP